MRQRVRQGIALACAMLALAGCAAVPLVPYTTETPPLALLPAAQAGVADQRGRFREIYCAVLARDPATPDHRACEDALTRVGREPVGPGQPVPLDDAPKGLAFMAVPGIGWDCFATWLAPPHDLTDRLKRAGFALAPVKVDGLSSSANNARQIRDAVLAAPLAPGTRIVIVGYSKGAADALEAVVRHPEVRSRVAAVVAAGGAVGGSPLANEAEQGMANLLQYFPGATCTPGDGGGVASLRPAERQQFLADHRLPPEVRYYSLVNFPSPERISAVLQPSYRRLARIDGRNDGQVLFYDQLIPGSHLLGYVNADHWALAVPIARRHAVIAALFVTENAYPREALAEAVMRYVHEDLARPARQP
jgi:hypothetical protein